MVKFVTLIPDQVVKLINIADLIFHICKIFGGDEQLVKAEVHYCRTYNYNRISDTNRQFTITVLVIHTLHSHKTAVSNFLELPVNKLIMLLCMNYQTVCCSFLCSVLRRFDCNYCDVVAQDNLPWKASSQAHSGLVLFR